MVQLKKAFLRCSLNTVTSCKLDFCKIWFLCTYSSNICQPRAEPGELLRPPAYKIIGCWRETSFVRMDLSSKLEFHGDEKTRIWSSIYIMHVRMKNLSSLGTDGPDKKSECITYVLEQVVVSFELLHYSFGFSVVVPSLSAIC